MKHRSFDIIIAGGGHAGVEAAHAACKIGATVGLVTMDAQAIGRMSCNPAIGGLGKGHLVQEIDALGGLMGSAADSAGIQFKTLNKSKGRAVWSLRAQIDKKQYPIYIQKSLFSHSSLEIITGEVVDFIVDNNEVSSVVLGNGSTFSVKALIICSGTFLKGLIHIGNKSYPAGRYGEKPSISLADNIVKKGFKSSRLKTGTPPRLDARSINWNKTDIADGDPNPTPFSQRTPAPFNPPNHPCHIVHTNDNVHNILRKNLNKSAMYSGNITGAGPRYCPSVEDKIVRFKNRDEHQLFLEPEWTNSNQIYVNGFSTSMPQDVQTFALRSIPALKNVDFIRPGYAIEYDFIPTWQLRATLETKKISGLYFAGQLNGTSGYEEAAAQGLIAGANAAIKLLKKSPLILNRSDAYIGVMIDDLITKDINEPYRMFTSRAEHRLSLRGDNAHVRLGRAAYNAGLINKQHFSTISSFQKSVQTIKDISYKIFIKHNNKSLRLADYIKMPKNTFDNSGVLKKYFSSFSHKELFTAETDIKYDGYVKIENVRVEKLKKLESVSIPRSINYASLAGLSTESKEKLSLLQPETLGQASRIAGIRPSDVSIIAIYINS